MEASIVITRFHLAPTSGGIVAIIQTGILNNVVEAGSVTTNVSTPTECLTGMSYPASKMLGG